MCNLLWSKLSSSCNCLILFISYAVTPKNTNKITQSKIISNVELPKNRLIKLKIRPTISIPKSKVF